MGNARQRSARSPEASFEAVDDADDDDDDDDEEEEEDLVEPDANDSSDSLASRRARACCEAILRSSSGVVIFPPLASRTLPTDGVAVGSVSSLASFELLLLADDEPDVISLASSFCPPRHALCGFEISHLAECWCWAHHER